MKYNQTGNFTPTQEKLVKEISDKLKKLRKSGCTVLAKGTSLYAYKNNDMNHANPLHEYKGTDYKHPIKSIDAGNIDDSGADDTEYFKIGYITEN